MAAKDRNNPRRYASSDSDYSLMEFMREYPDDAACLDRLWRDRFAPDGHHAHCPKCDRERKFHRTRTRASYTCDTCGLHIHPTAGTIMHRSATSLHLWFYAMYLMTSTRCAVSAKHLERELGVTYKTAWRMANLIRNKLMVEDGDEPLSGDVEVDETSVRGRYRGPKRTQAEAAKWRERQPSVLGMVERGGSVRASAIGPDPVMPNIREHVVPASMVYTDDWRAYDTLGRRGYTHRRIAHSEKVYVEGDVHTQTIEGFFSLVKNGIRGTYHAVSTKWLQGYLNEFAWRYNHRDDAEPQFRTLLLRAVDSATS
jgi:transposase-like protein